MALVLVPLVAFVTNLRTQRHLIISATTEHPTLSNWTLITLLTPSILLFTK